MLKCPCVLVNVGQTKQALKICISQHRTWIVLLLALHYAQAKHGSSASLKLQGTIKLSLFPKGGAIINSLLCREADWIHAFNTVEPFGLNKEQNLDILIITHYGCRTTIKFK